MSKQATSKSVFERGVENTQRSTRVDKNSKTKKLTFTKNEKEKNKIQTPVDFLVFHLLEMRTKTDEQ